MKKVFSIFVIVITLCLVLFGIFGTTKKEEYIRIHVRANSNFEVDQNIKYKIKDDIVSYLIPKIAECKTRDDFVFLINENLNNLKILADDVLQKNGFEYKSNVKFCVEEFPTRSYDGVVLESGFYDAIIVELGSAKGDNWWCVVYPPLCFVSSKGQDVMYKSKILEILKSILK